MKKNNLFALAILISIKILCFQISFGKDFELQKTDTCPGLFNTSFIEYEEASSMRDHFNTIYAQNPRDRQDILNQFAWINQSTFLAIVDTLHVYQQKENIDGLCIVFGSHTSWFTKKLNIMLVPTQKDTMRHTKYFGLNFFTRSSKTINVELGLSKSSHEKRMEHFAKNFRRDTITNSNIKPGKDSLSISVWISICTLDKIADFVRTYSSTGVKICPAAYKTYMSPENGQKSKDQSTFLLIPTRHLGNSDVEDDWRKPVNFSEEESKQIKVAYNHGELCPIKCPKPGN